MNIQELIQNQCIQKIIYIHKATFIINEDKYLPAEHKSKVQKLFRSELEDTYRLCLPFFTKEVDKK